MLASVSLPPPRLPLPVLYLKCFKQIKGIKVMERQREKMKILVFILWDEFKAKQANIAKVLNVSEGTISLWLKEMRLRHQVLLLEKEVVQLREIANQLNQRGVLEYRPTFDILDE